MKDFNSQKAFTLVETMVAISILAIAVAGPLVAASRAYNAALLARQQLTALYLAQEGIEYIRAMRDNEYLAANAAQTAQIATVVWQNFTSVPSDQFSISKCLYNPATTAVGALVCTLDTALTKATSPNNSALTVCSSLTGSQPNPACTNLNTTPGVNAMYTQVSVGNTPSIYRRYILMNSTAEYVRIRVTVDWNYRGQTYYVSVIDRLTSWQ